VSDEFVPGNDLEMALVRAARDPSARPEFYRRLLEADLFFLTPSPPVEDDRRASDSAEEAELLRWQGPLGSFVPCFSARERVRHVVEPAGQPGGFVAIRGRHAFERLAQMSIEAFLNPGLGYGKRFARKEILRLVAGTIFSEASHVVQKSLDAPTQQREGTEADSQSTASAAPAHTFESAGPIRTELPRRESLQPEPSAAEPSPPPQASRPRSVPTTLSERLRLPVAEEPVRPTAPSVQLATPPQPERRKAWWKIW
jgi:hypothetical protein